MYILINNNSFRSRNKKAIEAIISFYGRGAAGTFDVTVRGDDYDIIPVNAITPSDEDDGTVSWDLWKHGRIVAQKIETRKEAMRKLGKE